MNLAQYLSNEDFQEDETLVNEEGQPQVAPAVEEVVVPESTAPELIQDMELEVAETNMEVPVSDEAVVDADEAIEENVEIETSTAAEVNKLQAARTDAEGVLESLEHFQTVLQHGLKHKQFSPQFAATVSRELDRMNGVFGGQVKGLPSLESYDRDGMEQYYEASLESFAGFIKRVTDAVSRMSTKLGNKLNNKIWVDSTKKAADALNVKADKAIQDLTALNNTASVEIKIPGAARKLAIDGKVPSSLPSAATNDQRLINGLAGATLKSYVDYSTAIIDLLDEASTKGGEGKTGAIVRKALALKTPADSVPAAVYDGQLLGGPKFNKPAAGDGTIKGLIKSAYPDLNRGEFASRGETVSLSKGDAIALVKAAKVYSSLMVKLADGQPRQMFDNFYKRLSARSRAQFSSEPTSWSEGKELDQLVSVMEASCWKGFELLGELLSHSRATGEALVAVANEVARVAAKEASAPAAAATTA